MFQSPVVSTSSAASSQPHQPLQVMMDYNSHHQGQSTNYQPYQQTPHFRFDSSSSTLSGNEVPPAFTFDYSAAAYNNINPQQHQTTSTSLFSQSELKAFDGFLNSLSAPLSLSQQQQESTASSLYPSYSSSSFASRPDLTGSSSTTIFPSSNWSSINDNYAPPQFQRGTYDTTLNYKYQAYHPTAAAAAASFARPSSPSSASSSSHLLLGGGGGGGGGTSSSTTSAAIYGVNNPNLSPQHQAQHTSYSHARTSNSPFSTNASYADETLEDREKRLQHQASDLKAWLSRYNGQKLPMNSESTQSGHHYHNNNVRYTPSLSGASVQMDSRDQSSDSLMVSQQQRQQVSSSSYKPSLTSQPASIRHNDNNASHSPLRQSNQMIHSATMAYSGPSSSVGSTSNSESLPTPSSKLPSHYVPFLASSSNYAPSDSEMGGAIRPHDTILAEEPKAKRHRSSQAQSEKVHVSQGAVDESKVQTGGSSSTGATSTTTAATDVKQGTNGKPKATRGKARTGSNASASTTTTASRKKAAQTALAGVKTSKAGTTVSTKKEQKSTGLTDATLAKVDLAGKPHAGTAPELSQIPTAVSPPARTHSGASGSGSGSVTTSTNANANANANANSHAVASSSKIALTEDQKRANHIASEQKRRYAIRAAYDALCTVVPTLKAAVKEYEERLIKLHPDLVKAAAASAASTTITGVVNAPEGRLDGAAASASAPAPAAVYSLPTVAGVLTGGIEVGGEKIDGRAGPKSEAVVLAKTVEYMRDLLDDRESALVRLQELQNQVKTRFPPLTLSQVDNPSAVWNQSWKVNSPPAALS